MKLTPSYPTYQGEVFTTKGTNPENMKEKLIHIADAVPTEFDKGTYYDIKILVSLENLKKINDINNVIEVTGHVVGEGGDSQGTEMQT